MYIHKKVRTQDKHPNQHESAGSIWGLYLFVMYIIYYSYSWAITYWSHVWEAAPKAVKENENSISGALASKGGVGVVSEDNKINNNRIATGSAGVPGPSTL